MELEESGYGERALKLLRRYGASIYDRVRVRCRNGLVLEGVLLPRPGVGNVNALVIKLDNGYNVGVDAGNVVGLEVMEKHMPAPLVELRMPPISAKLPKVYFVGTGGTIASRVDYKTGAVYPFFTAEEIYSMIPELEDVALIKAETLFNIFSEDMTPKRWEMIARKVVEVFEREEPKGVVIAHGTDTMGYSAAALAFALRDLPGPVVFVGAQRSSDRPSTDAVLNVMAAVTTCIKAPFGESVVVMHGSISDDYCLVHRGVRVRKCHTSRRDAFRSINDLPLAIIKTPGEFKLLNKRFIPRSSDGPRFVGGFDDKVALVKFYPGMGKDIVDFLVDKGYHGIVIEGTGLGHVAKPLVPAVKRAVEEGVAVVIASQCLWGRVNMNVYRRGVELLQAGAIPAEDMIPETAYVKLCWVLARTRDLKEVRRLMLTNVANELYSRTEHRTYPPVLPPGVGG